MLKSTLENLKWPERLKEISKWLQNSQDDTSHNEALGEAWKILYFALSQYLRSHASRLGELSQEDREDLAEEKALDLINRIVSKKTDFSDRLPSEIASFLSKVARNDLLDFYRKRGRRVEPKDDSQPEWEVGRPDQRILMNTTDSPDVQVERKEFAGALRRCIDQMDQRSRLIWFFRVFYELSSKDIAVHGDINLKATHVDVLLQRSRKTIRDCMHQQNYNPHDMPPGIFTEL